MHKHFNSIIPYTCLNREDHTIPEQTHKNPFPPYADLPSPFLPSAPQPCAITKSIHITEQAAPNRHKQNVSRLLPHHHPTHDPSPRPSPRGTTPSASPQRPLQRPQRLRELVLLPLEPTATDPAATDRDPQAGRRPLQTGQTRPRESRPLHTSLRQERQRQRKEEAPPFSAAQPQGGRDVRVPAEEHVRAFDQGDEGVGGGEGEGGVEF